MAEIIWAVGVMTVPKRAYTLLPRTLASLRAGGFEEPRLFPDDCPDPDIYASLGLPVSARYPKMLVAHNWMLSIHELYLRNPQADRFALFQDDVVCVRNLRSYLERCPLLGDEGKRAYLNPYVSAGNAVLAQRLGQEGKQGWFPSNQLGKGALCLVFDNRGVRELLQQRLLVDRPRDAGGWRSVDGGISEALCRSEMGKAGTPYTEWCHRPSLVQHTGEYSVVDKRKVLNPTDHPQKWVVPSGFDEDHPIYKWEPHTFAPDFPGEDFDAMSLLK